MKPKKKNNSGSVKVEPEVLQEARTFCKEKGWLVSHFSTEAIREKLVKAKSGK